MLKLAKDDNPEIKSFSIALIATAMKPAQYPSGLKPT